MATNLAGDEKTGDGGLRDRKKAKRRDEILFHAKAMFAERGIDATTMAQIAEAAGVSPPTVFNYFGNKDGILIALITEGSRNAIAHDVSMVPRTDSDFATILVESLLSVSEETLNIAAKRVWRYSEAAAIRHPNTELAREYRRVDRNLLQAIEAFLARYDFRLRSGEPADVTFLGELVFDIWNACFFELIRNEKIDLKAHRQHLSARLGPLVKLLFEDTFLSSPLLKTEKS